MKSLVSVVVRVHADLFHIGVTHDAIGFSTDGRAVHTCVA